MFEDSVQVNKKNTLFQLFFSFLDAIENQHTARCQKGTCYFFNPVEPVILTEGIPYWDVKVAVCLYSEL